MGSKQLEKLNLKDLWEDAGAQRFPGSDLHYPSQIGSEGNQKRPTHPPPPRPVQAQILAWD